MQLPKLQNTTLQKLDNINRRIENVMTDSIEKNTYLRKNKEQLSNEKQQEILTGIVQNWNTYVALRLQAHSYKSLNYSHMI